MDSCYDREQFPTLEQAYDWCWARSDEEKAAVRFVLEKFFVLQDGIYYQGRIQEEIDRYHKNASINSKIAQEREERRRTNRATTVNESTTDLHLTTNQEPLTKNQEPIKKPMQRGTRLPADSPLSEDWILFCRQERPDLVPSDVYAEFRDYWVAQPGQKGVKTDWPATWRNWVRRQKAKPQQSAWQQKESRKQDHYNQIFGERSDDGRTIDATPLRLG